jgi:hypothetical protein
LRQSHTYDTYFMTAKSAKIVDTATRAATLGYIDPAMIEQIHNIILRYNNRTLVMISEGQPIATQFIRLPKHGMHCQVSGFGRSGIESLIRPCKHNGFNPPVRSINIHHPARKRCTRLLDYKSLMTYLSTV